MAARGGLDTHCRSKSRWCASNAQAVRASLLASATTATLAGRRSISLRTHSGALGALAMLQGSGLDMSKLSQFVPMFFTFAKGKAGNELVGRVLGKLPELAKMVH